jgi:histidine ammonia-lyase
MITLGDSEITLNDFYNVTVNKYSVQISADAIDRINASRNTIEQIINDNKIVYGITTGFGSLSTEVISKSDTMTLQLNLIRSHAIGCGDPSPEKVVRGMMLLRLVCICKGHSGVRLETVNKITNALNNNYIPYVPIL